MTPTQEMEEKLMIIAVEGPSAAGKTTLCQQWERTIVPEYQPTGGEPADKSIEVQAHFWNNVNTTRWNAARLLENKSGLAICDTDPMHLHYSWTLARSGHAPKERFEFEAMLVREALVEKRIGFADAIAVNFPTQDELRQRKNLDSVRVRADFELQVQLREPLREWYQALEEADPGSVVGWDVDIDAVEPRQRRYDAALFDALLHNLPTLR
ncbi:hypothetical protein SFC07_02105 [Corynebacterium callunae]|uniref:hypothetical protein n=1 Tax=Corynebacterium callunae TaxID=1721 RepID=UPI0039821A9A